MDVDEPWRQDMAACIDDAGGRSRTGFGRGGKQCDAIAANAYHALLDYRLIRFRSECRRAAQQDVELLWYACGIRASFLFRVYFAHCSVPR